MYGGPTKNLSNAANLMGGKYQFDMGRGPYTPDEAQAVLAAVIANPIPAVIRWRSSPAMNGALLAFEGGRQAVDPGIKDQTAEPENPGIRRVTASTHGNYIPVSIGRRRLSGNVLQSSALVPELVGTRKYTIEYQVPIYDGPRDDVIIHNKSNQDNEEESDERYSEQSRSTSTKRVSNPNDANQWVDVEVVNKITLTDVITGQTRTYILNNV